MKLFRTEEKEPVGGFFGLETNMNSANEGEYHKLNCLSYGRACLAIIFSICKISKLYLPLYICQEVVNVIKHYQIPYQFYHLDNNFRISDDIKLKDDDYLLVVNYFGLMGEYIVLLNQEYSSRLIIDNTQAFYDKPSGDAIFFNSGRKFFGIPDGAYLNIPIDNKTISKNEVKIDYLVNKFYGFQEIAYKQYKNTESTIKHNPRMVSNFSKRLLKKIDYSCIAKNRRKNFMYLADRLKDKNVFEIDCITDGCVPMCYPFLPDKKIDKSVFIKENIFIPTFWSNINWLPTYEIEKKMVDSLICLPIDQRMSFDDCDRIIRIINATHND